MPFLFYFLFFVLIYSVFFFGLSGGEVMERLTTLGITVNLVTYLTGTMHLGNAASANIVTNFVGTSFMLCLFGGFLGDTYIGRFVLVNQCMFVITVSLSESRS